MLQVQDLARRYGASTVFRDVSLTLAQGEFVALVGESGAGKSTLLNCIAGLDDADAGRIVVDGVELGQADELARARLRRLRLGFVFQAFHVLPHLSVAENVALPLLLQGRPDAARVQAMLDAVGLQHLGGRAPAQLSGGELQRVVLARALLRRPNLLVLDEPVRGVDYTGEAELYDLIGRIRNARGVGILLVSHDLHVVMAQSDRVICVNRHICCSGQPEAVAQHPEYVRLFGAEAARSFAVYQHQHDHSHDLTGAALPAKEDGGER